MKLTHTTKVLYNYGVPIASLQNAASTVSIHRVRDDRVHVGTSKGSISVTVEDFVKMYPLLLHLEDL